MFRSSLCSGRLLLPAVGALPRHCPALPRRGTPRHDSQVECSVHARCMVHVVRTGLRFGCRRDRGPRMSHMDGSEFARCVSPDCAQSLFYSDFELHRSSYCDPPSACQSVIGRCRSLRSEPVRSHSTVHASIEQGRVGGGQCARSINCQAGSDGFIVARFFCQNSEAAFKRKYIDNGEALGKGAFGTVSVYTSAEGGKVAVKKLRHG